MKTRTMRGDGDDDDDDWTIMSMTLPGDPYLYDLPLRRGQVPDWKWSAWLKPLRSRRMPGEIPYSRPGEWGDELERQRYYNWHAWRWCEQQYRRTKRQLDFVVVVPEGSPMPIYPAAGWSQPDASHPRW